MSTLHKIKQKYLVKKSRNSYNKMALGIKGSDCRSRTLTTQLVGKGDCAHSNISAFIGELSKLLRQLFAML